jgi:hypothetical protein
VATTKALELAQLADDILVNANGEITNIGTLSTIDVTGDVGTSTLTATTSVTGPFVNATTIATGYQLNGTTVLNYSGGNVIVGDLGAGVALKYIGTTHLSTVSGGVDVTGDLTISGDLVVNGNTVTLNTATLDVEDLNITLASGAANATAANGAGITIDGANAQITYDSTNDELGFNKPIALSVTGSGVGEIPIVVQANENPMIATRYNAGTDGAGIFLQHSRNATVGSTTALQDGDEVGFLGFRGTAGDGTSNSQAASIHALVSGVASTQLAGTLRFAVRDTTGAEKRTVYLANNRFGIGEEDPTATLYVKTSTDSDIGYFENTTASGNTKLTVHNNKSGDAAAVVLRGERVSSGADAGQLIYQNSTNIIANIRGMAKDSGSSTFDGGELFFYTSAPGTGSSVSLAMAIDQDGKVGIGKQIPEDKLHVNGSLQFGDMVAPAKATTTIGSGPDYNLAVGINQDNTNTGFDQIWGEWQSTASDAYYAIKWRDAGDTGTPATRLYINGSDGRVGIGTALPETKLHVQVQAGTQYTSAMSGLNSYTPQSGDIIQVRNEQNGIDDIYAGIWFETGYPASNNTGSDRTGRIAYLVENNAGYGGHFVFQTRGSNAVLDERLRIQQNGNIGIGITDPQYQLHVKGAGDIKIEDEAGGSAHLRIGATTAGVRDSEWKVKVSGSLDEFFIDHDYTSGGTSVGETAFKLGSNHSIYVNHDQPKVSPTLMLDFVNSGEVLDHRLIYHRSGVGTRVNSAGDIEYMRDGTPRFDHDPITFEPKGLLIERQSVNDLLGGVNTNYFDASNLAHLWNSNPSTQAYNAKAPDGTMSATLCRSSSSVDRVTASGSATKGGYISWSVFLKQPDIHPATATTLLLYNNTTAGQLGASNITWGATPTATNGATITQYKDGWWRFAYVSDSQVSTNDTVTGYVYIEGSGQYNQKGLYVWGGQLECLGSAIDDSKMITSYMPNLVEFGQRTTSATYQDENGTIRSAGPNQPRYGYRYDATTRKFLPTGLIAERASTNRMPNTYMGLNAAGWNENQNISVVDYSGTAPDGTKTASKFIPNAQTSTHSTYRLINASTGATCFSLFLKASGINYGFLYVDTVGGHSGRLWFDLTDGSYYYDDALFNNSTLEGYGVEDYGNGWYRPWIAMRHSTGSYYSHVNTSGSRFGDATHTPNGTDSFLAWGAQLEDGSYPTSFIYTQDGSTRTRAKDNLRVEAAERGQDICYADLNKNNWYNQNQIGTINVEFEGGAGTNANGRVFGIVSGYGGNERIDYVMSDAAFQPYVATNGVAQASYSNIDITDGRHSVALSFGKDHFRTVVDGGSVVNDMSGLMPVLDPGYLVIGHNAINSTNDTKAHFRKVAYYPVQLSDDEKKAITEG